MSIADAIAEAGAKPAGKRPFFLDTEIETVLAITMSLVQEVSVSRQRVDTLERLLEDKGILRREEIETFTPAPHVAVERSLATQEYIARVLRIIQQRNEANKAVGDIASEDVAVELGATD